MSSLPCKLAVRFVGSVKDDDITRWSTIQVRKRCQGAPLKNESPWWSIPTRVTGVQFVCTCTRLCISSFSVTGEREKEAFVVFTERRWKAIPANENKRVRPTTRRTNWRACYGWEFKEGWIGGWIGGRRRSTFQGGATRGRQRQPSFDVSPMVDQEIGSPFVVLSRVKLWRL